MIQVQRKTKRTIPIPPIYDTDDEADENRSNSGKSADFAYSQPERETISINARWVGRQTL